MISIGLRPLPVCRYYRTRSGHPAFHSLQLDKSSAGSHIRNKFEQIAPNLNRLGRILERNWSSQR